MMRTQPRESRRYHGVGHLAMSATAACPRLALLLLGLGYASCSAVDKVTLPPRLSEAPGDGADLAALADARRHFDQHRPRAALRIVEDILSRHPKDVDSQRVRQDILRERGRQGLVLREAEDRLAAEPTAAALYLSGRVQSDPSTKQQRFRAAIERDPGFFWGWFGLAFSLREEDPRAANRIYKHLYEETHQHERAALTYAASLLRAKRLRDATQVYEKLRAGNPGLGSLGAAQTLIRSGSVRQVQPLILEALRHRPFDTGVRALLSLTLRRGVRDDWIAEVLDVLRGDPERLATFERFHPSLLASLYARSNDPMSARSVLRGSSRLVAADRFLYRSLLIGTGDVAGFLADVRDGLHPEFLADTGNQVMERWRALVEGPWMRVPDPLGSLDRAVGLTRALIDVGYLEFADRVATSALLARQPEADADGASVLLDQLRQIQIDLRKELAFQSSMRRILTKAFRPLGNGKVRTLDEVLAQIRRASLRILGRDVVGTPRKFTLPFVGVLVDSLGGGLPAHLARYNKHLVMGQRNGEGVEAMILTRLALRHVDPVEGLPLPPRCTEVVGEHRQLEPMGQGDLAGIALLNHYVVDMDEVRVWAGRIRERRQTAREDDAVVLKDALPQAADALEPAGVEWRLSLLSPVKDSDLESAVLDVIRWHERGHMVDFIHYLPISSNLLRSLALVVRNGLNPLRVTAEMEGRAQLTALAMSPHTRIALAHTAGFLGGEPGGSPHAIGFRAMVSSFQSELTKQAVSNGDASRWHRLDPARVRETARKMLSKVW